MSLKQKTLQGVSSKFVARIVNSVIQFAFGVVLARLLTSEEYGLVGMLAIFVAFADTFVSSGFSEALIRKKEPSPEDYSTIFWLNIGTAAFFYLVFFFSAQSISDFFNEPSLTEILVVLNLVILIDAMGVVPHIPLIKQMRFKEIAQIDVLSNAVAGAGAITLALMGYGVWSLVWKRIIASALKTIAFNLKSNPNIEWAFSRSSFKELFAFSWKLTASRLLNEVYQNIYYLIIGKFFSAHQLGLFSRANNYKRMPSIILIQVATQVSLPVLAEIQDDNQRLKSVYQRMLRVLTYVSFPVILGLGATADHFIIGLIGEKWAGAIPYLQLLCLSELLRPLIATNLNVLVIKGRSDLYLTYTFFSKLFAIPVVLIGIFYGIIPMIIGMIAIAVVDYVIASYWMSSLINYSLLEQLGDILPITLLGLLIGGLMMLTGTFFNLPHLAILAIQCLVGLAVLLLVSELLKMAPYLELKAIAINRLKKYRR